MPNNMMRINCDCNVVEVLKHLSIYSMKLIKNCSNNNCLNQNIETTFHSMLISFENENIRHLQQKINVYNQFDFVNKTCSEEKCSGLNSYTKMYNNIVFIAVSNLEHKEILPSEVKN